MCDEYYRMPDGKIFCEKCWRHGREVAEMKAIQGYNHRLQVERDRVAFEQKRKGDQVKLDQLEHAIKLEKGKCERAWSEYEKNRDSYDKPFNYEEVEKLKRQRNDLENHLRENQFFRLPSSPPLPNNTNYFNNASFISRDQSHYFETVILPQEREKARKAEEERLRLEREQRKREEDKRKEEKASLAKHMAKLAPIEEAMLKREKQPLQVRVKIAKETYREAVMLRCAKDSAKTVRDALKQNPNVTAKVWAEIMKVEARNLPHNSPKPTNKVDKDNGFGCLLFFITIAIIGAIVHIINN